MPDIIDIADRLPRNTKSPNWRTRALGSIRTIVVHYDAVALPHDGDLGVSPNSPSLISTGDRAIGYDPVRRYIAQANYHMSRNWNTEGGPVVRGFGLMYHYRVSADGRIWRTQPEELVTWHARAANYNGLAICCDLGPGQTPPQVELVALKALLDWLCFHRPEIPASRPDVWGHGELHREGNQTACPGHLLEWVQAYRN